VAAHRPVLLRPCIADADGCVFARPTQSDTKRVDERNMTFYVSAAHEPTVIGVADRTAAYGLSLGCFAARTTSAICSAICSMVTSLVLKATLSASDGL
jgi:hypothetical protein